MQEKTMVADTLAGINGELTRYAGMIAQSENKELKQTLKQFRTHFLLFFLLRAEHAQKAC